MIQIELYHLFALNPQTVTFLGFLVPVLFEQEVVSKPQVRLKSKAQADEKAQHTR
jgi:hypothetical protein